MLGLVMGPMIRRSTRHVNEGRVDAMLSSYAQDAVSVFPGNHSWGGEYRGRDKIEGFLRRCVAAGLQFEIEDVVVSGLPWNARVCIRLANKAVGPDGSVVYSNRALIYARTSWGKIKFQETYEDTQRVVALDEYEASRASTLDAQSNAVEAA
jgi:ketosteroid isomerase-like protein